jgi:hypothetical protein
MSFWKKLPWLSLMLLLLTFISLGWMLAEANASQFTWLLVAIATLVLAASLSSPWAKIADYSVNLFTSNLKSFLVTVAAAFLFFLILARFRLFLDILVIIAASMLVRIDLQTAGFTEVEIFCFLTAFSLAGFGLGVLLENFTFHHT